MSATRSSTSDILKGLQSPAAPALQTFINDEDAFEFIETPRAELPADTDDGFAFVEAPALELEETLGALPEPHPPLESYLVIDEYVPTKPSVVGYEVGHRPMSPEVPQARKYAGQSTSERTLPTAGSTVYSQTAQSSPNLTGQRVPAWIAARQKSPDSKTSPSKHRDIKDLGKFCKPSDIKSFHKVSTFVNAEEKPTCFLKHVNTSPTNSAYTSSQMSPEQIMAELEPMAIAFFRLMAPDLFPSARTYKRNDVHAGVGSKAIGFRTLKEEPLTDADLENESYVAGLAVTITTSYILEEMDLHRKNLSKTGIRIDGDELLWPILSQYKFSETYDPVLAYKKLNINFAVHEDDITHLPNITYSKPYYWVTQSNSFLFGTIVPDNAYTPADIERFKRLEKHPVFVYHKYKTLLKFILTTPDMYRNLAVPHVTSASIRNDVVDHMSKRLQAFRDTLINMPGFREFLRVDGFKALTEILGEFDKLNAKLSAKVEKLSTEILNNPDEKLERKLEDTKNRIINRQEISDRYDHILRKCESKSVYSLSLHNHESKAELVFSARPN